MQGHTVDLSFKDVKIYQFDNLKIKSRPDVLFPVWGPTNKCTKKEGKLPSFLGNFPKNKILKLL